MLQVMLAIADSQIVGAECKWPKGWEELTARGIRFDVVDVDIPVAMAVPMLKTYHPKGVGARGSGLGARGSGLGARGSGLGARGSGLGLTT